MAGEPFDKEKAQYELAKQHAEALAEALATLKESIQESSASAFRLLAWALGGLLVFISLLAAGRIFLAPSDTGTVGTHVWVGTEADNVCCNWLSSVTWPAVVGVTAVCLAAAAVVASHHVAVYRLLKED
jgi:hypothetical protein